MARYHGVVGYGVNTETYPGVWDDVIVEKSYYGNIIKNRTNVQQNSTMNPTFTLSNSISIIADPFAYENIYAIRYATYLGKKWCVTGIELEHPRMILTLGGLYNE